MYQAAFNASQASPKKDKKDTNGTANKEKKSSDKKVTAPQWKKFYQLAVSKTCIKPHLTLHKPHPKRIKRTPMVLPTRRRSHLIRRSLLPRSRFQPTSVKLSRRM